MTELRRKPTGLRDKTIDVLKNLERYYRNLGDEYKSRVEEIQEQSEKLPTSEDLFLAIVTKYRKQLDTLDQIPSKVKNERIKLVLDRLISILRMKHLLKILADYTVEKKWVKVDFGTMQENTDEDEDEDDPETILEEYAEDDDVYVSQKMMST